MTLMEVGCGSICQPVFEYENVVMRLSPVIQPGSCLPTTPRNHHFFTWPPGGLNTETPVILTSFPKKRGSTPVGKGFIGTVRKKRLSFEVNWPFDVPS